MDVEYIEMQDITHSSTTPNLPSELAETKSTTPSVTHSPSPSVFDSLFDKESFTLSHQTSSSLTSARASLVSSADLHAMFVGGPTPQETRIVPDYQPLLRIGTLIHHQNGSCRIIDFVTFGPSGSRRVLVTMEDIPNPTLREPGINMFDSFMFNAPITDFVVDEGFMAGPLSCGKYVLSNIHSGFRRLWEKIVYFFSRN